MDSRYKTQAEIDKMTLEQRLQRLEDFDQIRKLNSQYPVLINDCRFDEFADLFTQPAVVDLGYLGGKFELRRGKAEIKEMFATIRKHLQHNTQYHQNKSIQHGDSNRFD